MITSKVRILKFILGFFSCLPSVLFLLTIVQNVKDTSQFVVVDPTSSQNKGQKDFIYLVQAEGCLPSHLLHPNQLGLGDNRDVIVLSWKSQCKNASDLSHVQYIYRNNTSWGTGRNLLYALARARRNNYLYYNFLDEDLEFKFTDGVPKEHTYNTIDYNSDCPDLSKALSKGCTYVVMVVVVVVVVAMVVVVVEAMVVVVVE
ncbi:hypothetical protein QZH41_005556 [Actinostola sp. cb2023]|nr:hypothetical protein QZH41_005556 [Actinostola sp. cb2023]